VVHRRKGRPDPHRRGRTPARTLRFGLIASWAAAGLFGLSGIAAPAGAVTGSDAAVAYQGDALHDGAQSDVLAPPLTKLWSAGFGGPTSYPVIAGAVAYVTAATNPSAYGTTLFALDLATGAVRWSAPLGGTYFWSALAYDGGRVFSLDYDGQLRAFDAATGGSVWTTQLPGQSAFTSAPTASNGTLYTGGAGSGGTLYAVDETTGAVKWTAPVANGDESSPVVTSTAVYVSYACEQAYAFDPASGALLWHHTSSCEGGGGRTPVLAGGRLWVRDPVLGNVELDPGTGSAVGSFAAGPAPAFSSGAGYFLSGGVLTAQSLSGGGASWTFSGDGQLDSAPLVANGVVYEGSASGTLFALSALTGAVLWSGPVGAPVPAPDEQNVSQPLTGLAIGQGTLLVPTGTGVVAFTGTPDFAMTAQPAQLRIQKNHNATSTITLTANAFLSATVQLSVTGVPASDKATLNPTSVVLGPSATATSVLSVTAGHTAGTLTLVVHGCAGVTCHSASVVVTVTS